MIRWLILGWLVLGSRAALGYPQFQLSSGSVRCNQCHIAPAGGGLLSPWGQDEAGDTIADGGNGRFLHGAITLPNWLAVGGDVRLAALANEVGASEGTELAAFPMQAEIAASAHTDAWSIVASLGARGVVRGGAPTSPESDVGTVRGPSVGSYLISREHYVMWKPSDLGAYVRLGRFAAPYGLRLADHTAYVRRYLGFNLLEETYGASAGWLGESVEVHATAFVFDPLQYSSRHEVGGAAMLEAQPSGRYVIGGSARVGVASASTRAQVGAHGKLWVEGGHLMLQGEVDGVREMFDGAGDRWQLVAYVGPVWIPARGIYAGIGYQAFVEDLRIHGTTRQSGDAWVSWLPRAHIEVMASGRVQRIGPQDHAYLGMLQVHYSL